ncbi:MAG: hypothetical protein ACRDOI_16465 [Trebonia sp.]
MRIRRAHGIVGGLLVALLGIWGGIIPFIGPYFSYAYTPDKAWTYNTGRLWLEILPGAGALLGGLLIMAARSRHVALFGSLLAIASGAWFALGNVFAPVWTSAAPAGNPASTGAVMRALEEVGFFIGLGIVIVLIAAAVAGRITAVPGVPAVTDGPAGRPTTPVPASRVSADDTETKPVR